MWAAVLGIWMGCSSPPPAPSVLIITIDTTRADRLGPYNYALADTPTYDALASDGTVFERAYATAPLTIPSHSSMFTGRPPPAHGVRDNGDFVLSEEAITWAERMQEAGYATAAFTSAFPTRARWGFGQGFDLYEDPLERVPTQLDWRDQRTAGEVVDGALELLPALPDGDQPLFVWVHLFDAHWPYAPPEPFASEHPGRPYDGEIAYADQQVGRLLKWWDARHAESIVILTSDHGEGFGDGGEQTHGFLLHDGTIHVPLIVRGTGFDAGERLDDPVSHVDMMPTVLDILGLERHAGLYGDDLRSGGSEAPYSEALTGQFNLGLAPLHAFTLDEGRYTEGGYGAFYSHGVSGVSFTPEPSADTAPMAERMEAMLVAMGEDSMESEEATLDAQALEQLMALGYMGGDANAEAGEVDPRDVIDLVPLTWQARQLMGMGRLPAAEKAIEKLEEGMPGTFGVDLLRARLQQAQGRPGEAAESYADLFFRSPSSTVALQLASIHASMGAWAEAEDWFQEALDLQPASPEAMFGLVNAARNLGDTEWARELAYRYLEVYPDHAELMLVMAELHLLDGRAELALADAERALDRMPWSPWAHSIVAQAYWETGQPDPAIERLQDALRIDRANLPIRIRLTECLLEVGRNAEAVRTIRPAARLLPDLEELRALEEGALQALDVELGRVAE